MIHPQRCDRCGVSTLSIIVSMFNLDQLCRRCKAREQAHPLYDAAARAEAEACRRGDYNFAGIGRPADL